MRLLSHLPPKRWHREGVWYNLAMKHQMMAILVCPVCRGKLELSVTEENEEEVVNGALYCPRCQVSYPIEDTIPNLLPPDKDDIKAEKA